MMKRRLISRILLASGTALLAIGLWSYLLPASAEEVSISDADPAVRAISPGETSTVTYHVVNGTGHSIQVIGFAPC
jgi:hypothetical protein